VVVVEAVANERKGKSQSGDWHYEIGILLEVRDTPRGIFTKAGSTDLKARTGRPCHPTI